ncbi:MAG: phosphotransferase [Clostridiales bacterium]|nr:phosphotransferase [Clostridiales bacterium]
MQKLFGTFIKSEPVEKGWSEDKKTCVTAKDGTKYLLRVSPISRYETRKSLFTMLEKAAALDIPMCVPVEFGTCEDGVYSIQSWIDGEDLETVLPALSETEQYVLGLKSGEIIRKIHTLPAPETQEEWESRFNRKTDMKIKKYLACGLRFDGDEHILAYIEENRHLLKKRPQSFQHGDYHVGNMMVERGELTIIDFDRYDFGDPWEEFNRIVWSAAASPQFATGQLRGYFGGEPPLAFFKLLAFYIAVNTLSSIYWAIPFGPSDLDTMMKQAQDVLEWFDNMNNPKPTWYLDDVCVSQEIDGVSYKLKEPYDFSFINKYGKVFKVFDEQGINVCFGVDDGSRRYFVKFAGAKPINFDKCNGSTVLAVEWLKKAVSVYRDCEHPSLIKFIYAEEIGGGYAAVFEWVDAEGIEPLNSPGHKRFMGMEIVKKIQAFEDIMSFHALAAAKGYVAIDFYDGSILYDYVNDQVIICDIDFYQKSPYVGEMGLWGSTRYVSPEECTPGAVMDEITIVYTMGATAFMLFNYDSETDIEWREQGVEFYRTRKFQDTPPKSWQLSAARYDVVRRAVHNDRDKRQQSIRQLISEWKTAGQGDR